MHHMASHRCGCHALNIIKRKVVAPRVRASFWSTWAPSGARSSACVAVRGAGTAAAGAGLVTPLRPKAVGGRLAAECLATWLRYREIHISQNGSRNDLSHLEATGSSCRQQYHSVDVSNELRRNQSRKRVEARQLAVGRKWKETFEPRRDWSRTMRCCRCRDRINGNRDSSACGQLSYMYRLYIAVRAITDPYRTGGLSAPYGAHMKHGAQSAYGLASQCSSFN